jgi:hypothetical protein
MVEDVEIYNTMLNAGLANITYQTSIQIGDNSVVNTYNTFSLMCLQQVLLYGKGIAHLLIHLSNMGMFMDNRVFSDSLTQ